ncbi:VOC family protein [Streptantibioticus silvisoli]|uniref:VOC family protein n=1 Tax=Streptantibioticus silvisoli TaxID=2705255 RepID=A0ABT6VS70_9ACTN|nr:VOC family protein [Streptantibioticus silvisoli]MDI5961335.1 VOC family protein [Streptantibioticus silvisoli]
MMTNSGGFTVCLWFDGQAEQAVDYYLSVFRDSARGRVTRWAEGGPGEPGSVLTAEFTANGQRFVALNGGPQFTFDEAISFQIHCADQAEVDHYWQRLTEDGGQESQCGWVKDRFGVSWQVVPAVLPQLLTGDDPAATARAMRQLMGMGKLDIAELQRAYRGE